MKQKLYIVIMMLCWGCLLFSQQNTLMASTFKKCCTKVQKIEDNCCQKHQHNESPKKQQHCSNDCATCYTNPLPLSMVISSKVFQINNHVTYLIQPNLGYYWQFLPPSPLQDIWQPPKIS